MQVIVPFDGETPKTRLDPVLDRRERRQFARTMLEDVLGAIRSAGGSPLVLSTTSLDIPETPVCVDDRDLSVAVNAQLRAGPGEVAVVMADLPLVTAATLERLFEREGDVVIAYGIGGGTNALVSRHPAFRVDYHEGSYHDHLANAREVDAEVSVVDSYRLSHDIDEPNDLVDVLLYGDGAAATWLRQHGFSVSSDTGRSTIQRPDPQKVD